MVLVMLLIGYFKICYVLTNIILYLVLNIFCNVNNHVSLSNGNAWTILAQRVIGNAVKQWH